MITILYVDVLTDVDVESRHTCLPYTHTYHIHIPIIYICLPIGNHLRVTLSILLPDDGCLVRMSLDMPIQHVDWTYRQLYNNNITTRT